MTPARISYLMLVVTRSCNLACAYCYESAHEKHKTVMNAETAGKAIGLAAASGKPFHVQITGGEPLLQPDAVFAILEQIRNTGITARVALQTNGVLLDREMIRRCREYGVTIGLSVDGPPGIQEELRGGSTATYRAMKLLDEEGAPFRVTAVVTGRNVGHLHLLAMSLNGFSSAAGIALDLLVQKGRAAERPACDRLLVEDVRSGVWKLLETLRLFNRLRSRPLELREKNLVRNAFLKGFRGPYCAASCGSSLAVTPEGLLYPCTQTMDDHSCFLGSLERFEPQSACSPLEGRVFQSSRCAGCALYGRCPGECPSRLLYNQDDGEPLFCALYKTIFDFCVQSGDIVV